jgi:hypothetical protein
MLLKSKHFAFLMVLATTLTAQAGTVSTLSFGAYDLISGDKNICKPLEVTKKDLREKDLRLGGKESFALANEQGTQPSDLDKNCEFKETSVRKDDKEVTTFVRTNEEICKGKTATKSVATAEIRKSQIKMVFSDQGGELTTCVYKLK